LPQCEAQQALTGHGFYQRTLVDVAFDGVIRVRRYLCRLCERTVSLSPDFALPWLRFSLTGSCCFWWPACSRASPSRQPLWRPRRKPRPTSPFGRQAERLCAALAGLTTPPPAANFVTRALRMLQSVGWIAAHRFLFADLRMHLLGLPAFLAPDGRVAALRPAV